MEKRNRYTSEFKAKVVMELLREESTLAQMASKYQLNPQMVSQWKSEFVKKAPAVFEKSKDEAGELRKEMDEKEAQYQKLIGQLSYEVDWLKKNLAANSTTGVRKQWQSRITSRSPCPVKLNCLASTEPAYTIKGTGNQGTCPLDCVSP